MEKQEKKFKKLIEKSERILLMTHKGPDLDGFCSMIAIYFVLKGVYPEKDIRMKSRQTPNVSLPGMKEIEIVESIDYEGEDLVIITDSPELRLCINEDVDTIQNGDFEIVFIDHHIELKNGKNGWIYINELRSSATEQAYVTLKNMFGQKIVSSPEISTLVQYGIIADTNRFLYDGTTPETFRIFAEVKENYSVDIDTFVYKTSKFTRESTPVVVDFLESLQIEGDMAYIYISRERIEEKGYKRHTVSNAQLFLRDNYLRYIQGVHWGFVVFPVKENEWRVSFRSTKGYQNVEVIAKALGGGGHMYSSATLLHGERVEDIVQKVIDTAKKFVS